jgi:UDP-glucose 4-epimerase
MAALGQLDTLHVFGTDYPTPDGTAIRDYIHVCDLATAHVAALRYLLDGGETVALNLGTGKGHSVLEIIESVGRVTGRDLPVRHGARRPGDPPVLVADPAKARRLIGFAAGWTELDRVVESAWRWHRKLASAREDGAVPMIQA